MEESLSEETIKKEDTAIKNEDKKAKMSWKRMKLSKKNLKTAAYLLVAVLCWITILQYATAQKYDAIAKVAGESEASSANIDAEKLDYGVVAKGKSSLRFITVANRGNHEVYIKVLKSGDIADIMQINATDFTLKAGETKELELTIGVPEGTDEDEYDGVIRIVKIPKLF